MIGTAMEQTKRTNTRRNLFVLYCYQDTFSSSGPQWPRAYHSPLGAARGHLPRPSRRRPHGSPQRSPRPAAAGPRRPEERIAAQRWFLVEPERDKLSPLLTPTPRPAPRLPRSDWRPEAVAPGMGAETPEAITTLLSTAHPPHSGPGDAGWRCQRAHCPPGPQATPHSGCPGVDTGLSWGGTGPGCCSWSRRWPRGTVGGRASLPAPPWPPSISRETHLGAASAPLLSGPGRPGQPPFPPRATREGRRAGPARPPALPTVPEGQTDSSCPVSRLSRSSTPAPNALRAPLPPGSAAWAEPSRGPGWASGKPAAPTRLGPRVSRAVWGSSQWPSYATPAGRPAGMGVWAREPPPGNAGA